MVNKSLRKTFGICAATLMIISAGGNTLTASAKRYHHHRITRKIIRKHISRYQYNKEYATYKLFKKYIRNDHKRLNSTRRALKHHKHGRLNHNLRKHERKILSNLKLHKKAANLVYKWYHHFNKKYYIFTNHKNNKIRVTVKKRRSVHRPHKYSNKSTDNSVANNNNSISSDSNNSISSATNSDKESVPASSETVSQSLAQAYNSLESKSASISASGFSEFGEHGDGLNAYDKYIANPASSINSQINDVKSAESQVSLYNPASESAEAWDYINAISNVYNWINNKSDKFTVNDETVSAYYQKMGDYAYALGHDGNSFAMSCTGQNASAALPQLQDWYNQHNIDNSTEAKDAWYWNTRNLDGADDPNVYDHILATYDGYSKLHFSLNVLDGTADSPQPAQGTDASFNQALDDDAQTGDFNGIDGFIPDQ